jgi:hypothetical protein
VTAADVIGSNAKGGLIVPVVLDEHTVAFYLRINSAQVVIFQAIIESYEGIATVRTVDIEQSLISVLTTHDQVSDCQTLLGSLQPYIPWSCAADEVCASVNPIREDSVKSDEG